MGAVDWDRWLSDEQILLLDGTSYNSYLIMGGRKIGLTDTIDLAVESVLPVCLDNSADTIVKT